MDYCEPFSFRRDRSGGIHKMGISDRKIFLMLLVIFVEWETGIPNFGSVLHFICKMHKNVSFHRKLIFLQKFRPCFAFFLTEKKEKKYLFEQNSYTFSEFQKHI